MCPPGSLCFVERGGAGEGDVRTAAVNFQFLARNLGVRSRSSWMLARGGKGVIFPLFIFFHGASHERRKGGEPAIKPVILFFFESWKFERLSNIHQTRPAAGRQVDQWCAKRSMSCWIRLVEAPTAKSTGPSTMAGRCTRSRYSQQLHQYTNHHTFIRIFCSRYW